MKKIENLETLSKLQQINLSGNIIRSLGGLQGHDFLESIDMEGNEVKKKREKNSLCEVQLFHKLVTYNYLVNLFAQQLTTSRSSGYWSLYKFSYFF